MPGAVTAYAFDWKGFWDMASHVGTLVGLAAAGVWGYFNFVKSRTYYPHVEMTASGEIRSAGSKRYIVPRITLRNLGKSRVNLIQQGTGFRIFVTDGVSVDRSEMSWSGGGHVFGLFEEHKWIEPDETIFDEARIFAAQPELVAVKIVARLVILAGWWKVSHSEISCSAVVGPNDGVKGV